MTDSQLSLVFDASMADRFERFHEDTPRVYESFVALAREWVRRTGGRKVGIGALTERVRWEIAMATSDPEFKINNNFRAFYARLLMLNNSDLRGLFELRTSEADEWIQRQRQVAS